MVFYNYFNRKVFGYKSIQVYCGQNIVLFIHHLYSKKMYFTLSTWQHIYDPVIYQLTAWFLLSHPLKNVFYLCLCPFAEVF